GKRWGTWRCRKLLRIERRYWQRRRADGKEDRARRGLQRPLWNNHPPTVRRDSHRPKRKTRVSEMHVQNRQEMERRRLALPEMRLQVRRRSLHAEDEGWRDRRQSHEGSDESHNTVHRTRQPPRGRQSCSYTGPPDEEDEEEKKEGSGP